MSGGISRKMIGPKILLLLVGVFHIVWGEMEIKCTDKFCAHYIETKGCPELSAECKIMNATHYGTHLPYPDVCNCCRYCLTNILEGEPCTSGSPGMLPPTEVCGAGLSCDRDASGKSKCSKMTRTKCTEDQKEFDERKAAGNAGYLEVRPECDEDGLYAAAHCIPGSICYCVSPEGNRIFGESVFLDSWSKAKMTCGCSINDWKARNTIDVDRWEGQRIPVQTARCTEIGLFDPLQCMLGDSPNCACVSPMNGQPNIAVGVVNVNNITEGHPPCFDSKRHKPGMYVTACESMRASAPGLSIARKELFTYPVCQADGMFHRVQVSGSRKICVDPSGTEIGDYGADVNSAEAEAMNCHCARTVWLLMQHGVTELPTCCTSGNFKHWQYRRKQYYCVDGNGDQVGVEKDRVEELSCYQENDGQPCLIRN